MMATLNDIQVCFREINEAEDKVKLAKNGEGADKAKQIRENIKFISSRMDENRALIKKLQAQLRTSSFKGDEMKKIINNMLTQLNDKDKQLQQLRVELDAKDIHIAELDETINNLNSNVSDLQTETEERAQTISNQDKLLNTAWFVFGTKKELKEQRIIVDGKVLQSNFNHNYFTKIDIRVTKDIKLYSSLSPFLRVILMGAIFCNVMLLSNMSCVSPIPSNSGALANIWSWWSNRQRQQTTQVWNLV